MSDPEVLPPAPIGESAHPTSALAIASLVTGILTWFSLPLAFLVLPTPVCMIAAIICGHLARAEIRRKPGTLGDGMAIAGLVMGWGMAVTIVLVIAVALIFFGGLAALIAYAAAHGS
jgi:hypothetical protein